MGYQANGNKVIYLHRNGETHDVADCLEAEKAAKMLERGQYLQERYRKYTACARLYFQAEQLPGFHWLTPAGE